MLEFRWDENVMIRSVVRLKWIAMMLQSRTLV